MYIAQQLRKNNIAEYLLYMWQVEDLLRAYGCSLSRIRREYIERFDYTDEQKEEMTDWYGDLIRMMNQEGCRETGHLQINKVVMQQLDRTQRAAPQQHQIPLLHERILQGVALYRGTPQARKFRGTGNRDLLQRPLRHHDAPPAEKGNQSRYRTCHQGNHHLHRHALRLLQKRQGRRIKIRRLTYEYIDNRLQRSTRK